MISKHSCSLRRRAALAGAGAFLAAPAVLRAESHAAGVALVVGNSRYQWEAPLPNVKRDAPDIAKRLQALGLKTELVQDAGRDAMKKAIDTFVAGARGANLAAFYFAGHGATWGNDTYLVPIDADLGKPVVDNLVPVATVQTGMQAAAHRISIFDNCRNNPADGWRQREAAQAAGTRFAPAPPPPNSLELYSTAPGRVALDGPAGENSPFASALLRQLDAASVDLSTLPTKLRRELLLATQGRQVLFDQNTFQQPLLLKGPAGKAAGAERSGWGSDPSKLIELTNAYEYIRQNKLIAPAGLVAHRATAGSPHARKVGSFKFEMPEPGGGLQSALLTVLSVDETDGAEVIFSMKINGTPGWAFRRVPYSGDNLNMTVRDQGQGPRLEFKWADANSGSVGVFAPERGGGRALPPYSGKFARLDG